MILDPGEETAMRESTREMQRAANFQPGHKRKTLGGVPAKGAEFERLVVFGQAQLINAGQAK